MVRPAAPRWSFADVGRARHEVARLERLQVITTEEAGSLRRALVEKESELPVRDEVLGGARPLYRLLGELAGARGEVRLPSAAFDRLEDFYARRLPGLARTMGPLSPPESAAAPPPEGEVPEIAELSVSPPEAERAAPPPAPLAPEGGPPEERLADGWSLARFLESVNIGWGMLAAGLLIVGCSVALVITLWQSDVPVVRYLTFLGVALGLNGVGHFACRRLRLAITGNTLLAVSMLLMPLNLVAVEVLGGASGRAVSPVASAVILLGFAAVAWSSFRLVWPAGALTSSLAFAGLIGLQLAVEPLRGHGRGPELAVAWAGTAVYLLGLAAGFRQRRSDAAAAGPVPLVFTGGILAFAHLLLWVRVYVDGLGKDHFDSIVPVVLLHLLGGLMVGRELRRQAAGPAWARAAAAGLDTLLHLALPLVLFVMAPANGGRLLLASLTATVVYGTVAVWYRARLAVAAAAATTSVAAYALLVQLHGWIRGEFAWLPVSWSELALEMLPLVAGFLIAGEVLARRRRRGRDEATSWAFPVLAGAGVAVAGVLLGAMILDGSYLGEAVALLGGLSLLLALLTRRQAHAYAALASLPIVLALHPGAVADLVDARALVVWLGAVAIAYLGAGFGLARTRAPLAAAVARPLAVTSLLLVPPIIVAAFLPEITGVSVIGPLACLVICAGVAGMRPLTLLTTLAGGFYTLAVALALHRWVAPITHPVPASVAWALAAAVPPLALGLLLEHRGSARARLFGLPAFAWGIALVVVQPAAYMLTPTVTTTAVCSGVAGLLLLAASGVQRRPDWSWLATGFLGLTAFIIYDLVDPIGTGPGVPTWIPLAPLFAAVALLGGAGFCTRGWKRSVFAWPLATASVVATIATVCLTLMDPTPARKVWTLSLAVLPLLAIQFRLCPSPVFLLGLVGLVWVAMIGLFSECIDEGPQWISAVLAGTAAVAALAVGMEWGLENRSRRRNGVWLHGVSLGVLPVMSRVLGLGAAFLMGLVALCLFLTPELELGDAVAWPALPLLALGLLVGSWVASIWARGKIRFLLSIGFAGLAAVGWCFGCVDTPVGWRWLAFAFAAYAILWIAPGRLIALPRPVIERLAGDRGGRTARLAGRRARIVGLTSTGLALIVAAIHPDHPASIATGALLAACWLRIAARNRGGLVWQAAGVTLASVTAFAALHRLYPVFRDGGAGVVFDPDRLILHAWLAAVLAGVWYGRGRRDALRARVGRMPTFDARFLVAAGFVLSLVALGLLALFIVPALETEPIAARADYLTGAALILVLTVGYLVAAAWERRPMLVFLAEACLAGFFLYIRVTHPWIYRTHVFRRFWPLILVGVSYAATLLEQLLDRLRLDRIYVGPLRYTGLILPVGPLVGVWFRPEIDNTLITTVGAIAGFYAVVAYLHRSTFFAYVSTAVANATMIAWAHKLGWAFTEHPQIFLWPVGLSLLGVAQVQRAVLPVAAVRALRGIGACIIYGSMATAIFTDVAHQNLEMILLAIASVAGIAAGIGFRIRAFLYAGFGFLIFDVGYMVFRAGREDAWIWWMAGILLGVLVLLAFALFEKRKQDVERWLTALKTWE